MTRPKQGHCIGIGPTEILGSSSATQNLRAQIARAAPFSSSVLVTGPSGSGKEIVARSVHLQSGRCDAPFVPVDCASLTGELMASQMFGHVEGAFTGANHSSLGCFRAADGGTIFLDEIGELELPLQAKLLRTLQERVVTPVGSHEGEPIDVRVVAATNRDLRAEVAAGRFREDLYYRLNVIAIRTIALSLRSDDIADLAESFLNRMANDGLPHCTLSPGALELLQHYEWPGNVRQLKNFLEQAVISSDRQLLSLRFVQQLLEQSAEGGTLLLDEPVGDEQSDFTAEEAAFGPSFRPKSDDQWLPLSAIERQYVLHTLEHTYYNQSAAARLLGISRQALNRLIKKMDLKIPRIDVTNPRES